MFKKGDKIVYPVQGVGIIDLIEEKEFKGEMQSFYKIHLLNNSLKVMLPSTRVSDSNIRLISDSSTLDDILNNISDLTINLENIKDISSKERITNNTMKMKVGTLKDYMEVLINLSQVKLQHSLNASESQMLSNSKKFIVSEISLIKGISKDDAERLLNNSLNLS